MCVVICGPGLTIGSAAVPSGSVTGSTVISSNPLRPLASVCYSTSMPEKFYCRSCAYPCAWSQDGWLCQNDRCVLKGQEQ